MPITQLDEFERELSSLVTKASGLRPFICDGNPLTCQIFIVGFNAATSMLASFWQFWTSGAGFNKEAWLDVYKAERGRSPLASGRMRSPLSNSRRTIEWVIAGAAPCRCLETNLYSTPTATATDLPSALRSTAIFDFLVDAIRPKVILTHGIDAGKYFEEGSRKAKIKSERHFSRGWSQVDAHELGRQLKDLAG